MKTEQHDWQDCQLTQNQPQRLEHAMGQQIECLSGTAWVTFYGDGTDFILRAGQQMVVPNDGLALIEAVGEAPARVRLPLPARLSGGGQLALQVQDAAQQIVSSMRHSAVGTH